MIPVLEFSLELCVLSFAAGARQIIGSQTSKAGNAFVDCVSKGGGNTMSSVASGASSAIGQVHDALSGPDPEGDEIG